MAYDATDFVVTEVPAPVRDPKSITDPRERVAYLRDFLRELPPKKFNMADWHCGSAACIGGWVENLWFYGRSRPSQEVADALGLRSPDLFYPWGQHADGRDICGPLTTPTEAANVLDHYLATGKIDWSVA